MEIIFSHSNLEFKKMFDGVLKTNEIAFQLFSRNLSSKQEIDAMQIRGGIFDGTKMELMFLNALPFNLQIYSPNGNEKAFSMLVDYLLENNIFIRGVQGSKQDCDLFMKEYTLKSNKEFQLFYAMKTMKLTKENLKKPKITGTIRLANDLDIPKIHKMYCCFVSDTLQEQVNPEKIQAQLKEMVQNHQLYVFINDYQQLTSCVKLLNNFVNGGTLSFVFTDPKYRNHGHAKEMIYLLAYTYLKQKDFLTLFVDQKNPISNKVYVDIGFDYDVENYDFRLKNFL